MTAPRSSFRSFIRPAAALILLTGAASLLAEPAPSQPAGRRGHPGENRPLQAGISRPALANQLTPTEALPPLPPGVEELKWEEFFQMPIGPRGLEPTARLKGLAGKKVRLSGYFVFEDWGTCSCPPASPTDAAPGRGRRAQPAWMKHVVPGRAMFAQRPVSVSLGHYALCDDLPAQTAYLNFPDRFGEPVFYRPGFWLITGTLTLGAKEEIDGRFSFVRVDVETDEPLVGPRPTAHR